VYFWAGKVHVSKCEMNIDEKFFKFAGIFIILRVVSSVGSVRQLPDHTQKIRNFF